jgi:putative Mn2+ efflux pump MntP
MNRTNIATVCYALAFLVVLAIGIAHYSRETLLPWYAPALGVPWDQLPAGVKAIFVSYMKIAGAAQIGAALFGAVLTFGACRRGEAWANNAVVGIGCLTSALSAYGIYVVQARTGVAEPWFNPLSAFVLLVIGYLVAPRGAASQQASV